MSPQALEAESATPIGTPPVAAWIGLAVLLLFADHVTGPDVDLQTAYLVPVGLAAWYQGTRWALGFAATMPLARFGFDVFALWEPRPALALSATSGAVHVVVLTAAAVLVARLAEQSHRAAQTVDLLEGMLPTDSRATQMEAVSRTGDRQSRLARAQAFDHAGDMCVQMEAEPRALAFYGRALNAFLEMRDVEHATEMCHKIIDHSPHAVRARATLALLSLGRASTAEAEARIEDYVSAARRVGQDELAVNRLHVIAEVTDDRRLRARIATHLESLGDRAGSARILHHLAGTLEDSQTPPVLDDEQRWKRTLRAALMGPQELMRLARSAPDEELQVWAERGQSE